MPFTMGPNASGTSGGWARSAAFLTLAPVPGNWAAVPGAQTRFAPLEWTSVEAPAAAVLVVDGRRRRLARIADGTPSGHGPAPTLAVVQQNHDGVATDDRPPAVRRGRPPSGPAVDSG